MMSSFRGTFFATEIGKGEKGVEVPFL